jgi:hypothetical protein
MAAARIVWGSPVNGMSPNVKTGRWLSASHQGHDWRRIAVGTFTWRGKTTLILIRVHQDGLLLQRLYFVNEVT